jgi:hypothetical protein
MQPAFVFRASGTTGTADQRHTVMIGIAAHEHHAAGHHVVAVNVRYLETQHAGVKRDRAFEIGDHQYDVADFVEGKRWWGVADGGAQAVGVYGHGVVLLGECCSVLSVNNRQHCSRMQRSEIRGCCSGIRYAWSGLRLLRLLWWYFLMAHPALVWAINHSCHSREGGNPCDVPYGTHYGSPPSRE